MRIGTCRARYVPTILLATLASFGMIAQVGATTSVQREVDKILSQYAARETSSVDAYARLKELPEQAVVEALVTVLKREPGLKEGPHNFSYRMLRDLSAARIEVGFQQLLTGLWKPEIAPVCAEGLLDAPPEKQAEVLEQIRRYLQETKTPVEPKDASARRAPPSRTEMDFRGVLKAVARKGEGGLPYIEVLDGILRDPLRSVKARTWAAGAIVGIKPLAEALKHFQDLDDAGMEAALKAWPGSVAGLIDETRKAGKSFRDEYPELLGTLRQFVLKALRSPRPETQAAALEPINLVYGNDVFVIRSAEDYQVNPELGPLLEQIAANHPDPGVRSQLQRFLDPQAVDLMAKNILREREREAERKERQP